MKKLFLIFLFSLFSTFASAQIVGINGVPGQTITGLPTGGNSSAPQGLSGCGVQYVSALTYTVGACRYSINNVIYNSPLTNVTLSTADPSNPRIDVIYLDASQTVQVSVGTPAATPQQPTVNPSTQLALTFVLVPAGSSTPGNTTVTYVYLDGSGWVQSTNINVNALSTNNPYSGTHTVEFGFGGPAVSGAGASNSSYVGFTVPSSGTVTLSNYNNLVFYIRNKAAWPAACSLQAQWFGPSSTTTQPLVINNGSYGFSTTNTTGYQQLSIPIQAFAPAQGGPASLLLFMVAGTSCSMTGFYLGEVALQGGVGTVPPSGHLMNFKGTWSSTQTYNPNDTVVFGGIGYVALLTNTNVSTSTTSTWASLASGAVSGVSSVTGDGDLFSNSGSTGAVTLTKAGSIGASKYYGNLDSSGTPTWRLPNVNFIGPGIYAATVTDTTSSINIGYGGANTVRTSGDLVVWNPLHANSGSATLQVDSETSASLTKCGTTALAAGDLSVGHAAQAVFDGTQYQLLNPQSVACSSASGVSSLNSLTGSLTIAAGSGITVTPSGSTITIAASGGGGSLPFGGTGTTNATVNSVSTLAAAISACGSSPTTIQITTVLTPTTTTVPSNCALEFYDGGAINPTSSQVVTISGPISDRTVNQRQIFGGAGTVVLGNYINKAPIEWFGATGYATESGAISGSDSTTAINACFIAMTSGECRLAALFYKTTSALTIAKSNIGLGGISSPWTQIPMNYLTIPVPSAILSTSASANILNVGGTSTTAVTSGNKIHDLALLRSITPTGTAEGLNLAYTQGAEVDRIWSEDSVYDISVIYSDFDGSGGINNTVVAWGYNGFFETTGTVFHGYHFDGTANGDISANLNYGSASTSTGVTNQTIGLWAGTAIQDLMVDNFESYQNYYGIYLDGSGFGAHNQDGHFNNSILDNCHTCISINSVNGPMTFLGGWVYSTGVYGADIQSSFGTSIQGIQFFDSGSTASIHLHNSGAIGLQTNTFVVLSSSTGILLDGSQAAIDNNIWLNNGGGATGISLTNGSVLSTVMGNILSTLSVGISADGTSNNNKYFDFNTFSAVTTPISDSGSGNQSKYLGTTGTITGTALTASCDSGTASVTGAVVGQPVYVSSTTGADVGGAFNLRASVTSANTVTVYICGTGTPSSLAYNVVVQ